MKNLPQFMLSFLSIMKNYITRSYFCDTMQSKMPSTEIEIPKLTLSIAYVFLNIIFLGRGSF